MSSNRTFILKLSLSKTGVFFDSKKTGFVSKTGSVAGPHGPPRLKLIDKTAHAVGVNREIRAAATINHQSEAVIDAIAHT